ncbi:MAG: hypothetical protein WC817_02330 [Patescibacteria group bacterium]
MVILPPVEVIEKLIDINRQATAKNAAWGSLAKDDFLPHLSLAMGGVEYDNLEKVKNVIKDTISEFGAISIELNELYFVERPDGSRNYCFRVKNTSVLQQLHEKLMNNLRPYFSYDCTKDSLFSKPGEEIIVPDYLNKYLSSYSFNAFEPHITLRTKEAVGQEYLPIKFIANKVAVFHAGVMTTCRKEFFAVELARS